MLHLGLYQTQPNRYALNLLRQPLFQIKSTSRLCVDNSKKHLNNHSDMQTLKGLLKVRNKKWQV